MEDFEAAKQIRAAHGHDRKERERIRTKHTYVLRGLLRCGLCGRKMQGQQSGGKPHYRCRYPKDYALANHVQHPDNVYLKEEHLLPVLDSWLAKIFAPHRVGETIRAMAEQATTEAGPKAKAEPESDTARKLAECDAKLETYRAALESGADPVTVSGWIAEVKAERAAVLATARRIQPTPQVQMTDETINNMIQALGDMRVALQRAGREEKARLYSELDLRLTYEPGTKNIRAEMNLDPDINGVTASVRGGLEPPHP
ncbi:zinc ribbon domain-containing protein [Catenulispora yoronensis]